MTDIYVWVVIAVVATAALVMGLALYQQHREATDIYESIATYGIHPREDVTPTQLVDTATNDEAPPVVDIVARWEDTPPDPWRSAEVETPMFAAMFEASHSPLFLELLNAMRDDMPLTADAIAVGTAHGKHRALTG